MLDYGARIHRLRFRYAGDSWQDVVSGLEKPEDYLEDPFSRGACVGRYAGRLSGGILHIKGKDYPISDQEGITLHGGSVGFGNRYWEIVSAKGEETAPEIRLSYKSSHLEEGFPGNMEVSLTYRLEENSLVIRHEARTDRPTVVNLTNHAYFKIDPQPLISHYQFQLNADRYLETDERLLPTGQLLAVKGTSFDFQNPRPLGEVQLDTPFALDPSSEMAAEVYSRISGIRLQVFTNQPGIVVFTPQGFPAICLETQNFPDAPRFSHFPSALLLPDVVYLNESRFVFDRIG